MADISHENYRGYDATEGKPSGAAQHFPCAACGKKFSSREAWGMHVAAKHGGRK